ncbi:MAG: threonine synthase [Christensenellaceae bacterium]|jgi:threonine synthase|nr:threonine synthase [Christensenellaceae bacterium]
MHYQSTRNPSLTATASQAVLRGIAPDGGLYMLPGFSEAQFPMERLAALSACEISATVLALLLPDFTQAEMTGLVQAAYRSKFETEDLTPLVQVGDRYVLELFRGPTSAFKDIALSALPHLITASKAKNGIQEDILILTATSGDTGKAALEGFCDVPGTRIVVFYPNGGVSAIQKSQMVTQKGKNVAVCALNGNFDDAQSGVKAIFARCEAENPLRGRARLSSANSINIGRLAPQVMYYFKAYADLLRRGRISMGDAVDFAVPTGNFGDILAGCIAKRMGLPAGRFICASNANNVLSDFLHTGVYDRRRTFYKTLSPSMDILISSNLERLLYLVSGCDGEAVAGYMRDLASQGYYRLAPDALSAIQAELLAGWAGDAATVAAIRRVYEAHGYLLDTHTAVAWDVAERLGGGNPMVVLATASPYKFPSAVLCALGGEAANGLDEFARMRRIHEITGLPIPPGLRDLEALPALHGDVVERQDMFRYVLSKAGDAQ